MFYLAYLRAKTVDRHGPDHAWTAAQLVGVTLMLNIGTLCIAVIGFGRLDVDLDKPLYTAVWIGIGLGVIALSNHYLLRVVGFDAIEQEFGDEGIEYRPSIFSGVEAYVAGSLAFLFVVGAATWGSAT